MVDKKYTLEDAYQAFGLDDTKSTPTYTLEDAYKAFDLSPSPLLEEGEEDDYLDYDDGTLAFDNNPSMLGPIEDTSPDISPLEVEAQMSFAEGQSPAVVPPIVYSQDTGRNRILSRIGEGNLDETSNEILIQEYVESLLRESTGEMGYRPLDQTIDAERKNRNKKFIAETYPGISEADLLDKMRDLEGPLGNFAFGSLDIDESRKVYANEAISRELLKSDLTPDQKTKAFDYLNKNIDRTNPLSETDRILQTFIYDPSKIKSDELAGTESFHGDVAKVLTLPLNATSGLLGLVFSAASAPILNQKYYKKDEMPLDPRSNYQLMNASAKSVLNWDISGKKTEQDASVIARSFIETGDPSLNDAIFKDLVNISNRGKRIPLDKGPGIPFWSPSDVQSITSKVNKNKSELKKEIGKAVFSDSKSKFFLGNVPQAEKMGFIHRSQASKEFDETVERKFKTYFAVGFAEEKLYSSLTRDEQRYVNVFSDYFPEETAASKSADTIAKGILHFSVSGSGEYQLYEDFEVDGKKVDSYKAEGDKLLESVPIELRDNVRRVLQGEQVVAAAFGLSDDLSVAPVVLNLQQRQDLVNKLAIQYAQKNEIYDIREKVAAGEFGEKWAGTNIKGTPEQVAERQRILHEAAPHLLMVESMMANPTFASSQESYFNNLGASFAEAPFQIISVFAFVDALTGVDLFPEDFQEVAIELWKRDPAMMIANATAVAAMGAKVARSRIGKTIDFSSEDFKASPVETINDAFSEVSGAEPDGSVSPREALTMVSDQGSMTPIAVADNLVDQKAYDKPNGSVVTSPDETIGQYGYRINELNQKIAVEEAAPGAEKNSSLLKDLELERDAVSKLKIARERFRAGEIVNQIGGDDSIEVSVFNISQETSEKFKSTQQLGVDPQDLSKMPRRQRVQATETALKSMLDAIDELRKTNFDQAAEEAAIGRNRAYKIATEYNIPNFEGKNLERMVNALTLEKIDDYRVWKYVMEEGGSNPYVKYDNGLLAKTIAKIREDKIESATNLKRTAVSKIDSPSEAIPVVYTDTPIMSVKGDRNVAAQTDKEFNRIVIDRKEVERTFANKAWTKAKVNGVKAFPEDAFKTLSQWERFLIEHERAHYTAENTEIPQGAARENHANKVAYGKVMGSESYLVASDPVSDLAPSALLKEENYVAYMESRIKAYMQSDDYLDYVSLSPSQDMAEDAARAAFGLPKDVRVDLPFTAKSARAVIDKLIEQGVEDIPTYLVVYENTEISPPKASASKPTSPANISSKSKSALGRDLTNVGNNIQVEYKGRKFRNAEHAYQTWKSGTFDETAFKSKAEKPKGKKPANKETNYQTMVEILYEKFTQNPVLIEQVADAGGLDYLSNAVHRVTGRDKYWETIKGTRGKFIEAITEAYAAADVTHRRREAARSMFADRVSQSKADQLILLMERVRKAEKPDLEVQKDPITGQDVDAPGLLRIMEGERRAQAVGGSDRPDAPIDAAPISREAKGSPSRDLVDFDPYEIDDPSDVPPSQSYLEMKEDMRAQAEAQMLEFYEQSFQEPFLDPKESYLQFPGRDSEEFSRRRYKDADTEDYMRLMSEMEDLEENAVISGQEMYEIGAVLDGTTPIPPREFKTKSPYEIRKEANIKAIAQDLYKANPSTGKEGKSGSWELRTPISDEDSKGPMSVISQSTRTDPSYVSNRFDSLAIADELSSKGVDTPDSYFGLNLSNKEIMGFVETASASKKRASIVRRAQRAALNDDNIFSSTLVDEGPFQGSVGRRKKDPDIARTPKRIYGTERMPYTRRLKRAFLRSVFGDNIFALDRAYARTKNKRYIAYAVADYMTRPFAIINLPEYIKNAREETMLHLYSDPNPTVAKTNLLKTLEFFSSDSQVIGLDEFYTARLHQGSTGLQVKQILDAMPLTEKFEVTPELLSRYFNEVDNLEDTGRLRTFSHLDLHELGSVIARMSDAVVTDKTNGKKYKFTDYAETRVNAKKFLERQKRYYETKVTVMDNIIGDEKSSGVQKLFAEARKSFAESKLDPIAERLESGSYYLTTDQLGLDVTQQKKALSDTMEEIYSGRSKLLTGDQSKEFNLKKLLLEDELGAVVMFDNNAILETISEPKYYSKIPASSLDDFQKSTLIFANEFVRPRRDVIFDAATQIIAGENTSRMLFKDSDGYKNNVVRIMPDGERRIVERFDPNQKGEVQASGYRNNAIDKISSAVDVDKEIPGAIITLSDDEIAQGAYLAARKDIKVSDSKFDTKSMKISRERSVTLPTPSRKTRMFEPEPMDLLNQTLAYMSDYFDISKTMKFLDSQLENLASGDTVSVQAKINRTVLNILTSVDGGVRLISENGYDIKKTVQSVLAMSDEQQNKFLGKSLTTDERFFFEKSFEKAFTPDELLKMYANYQGSFQNTVVGLHNTINTLRYQNHLQQRGLILNRSEYNALPKGIKAQFINADKVKTKKNGERVLPTTLDGAYINKRVSRYFERQSNLQEAIRKATGFSKWFDKAQQITKTGLVIDVVNNSIARNLYSAVFVQGMLQADVPVKPIYYVKTAKALNGLAEGKLIQDKRLIRIIQSFSTDTSIKRDIKHTRGVQLMNEIVESFYQYAEDTKAVEMVEYGDVKSTKDTVESIRENISFEKFGMQQRVNEFLKKIKAEDLDAEVENQLNPSRSRDIANKMGVGVDFLISLQTHPDLVAKVAYAWQLEESGYRPRAAYAEALRTFVDYVDVPSYLNFLRFGGSGNPLSGFFGVLTSDFITFSAAQAKNYWSTVANNPVRLAMYAFAATSNDKALEETLKLKRSIVEIRSLTGDPTLQFLPGYTIQEAVGNEYGGDRGGYMGGAVTYKGSTISGQILPILPGLPLDPQNFISKMPANFEDWTYTDVLNAMIDAQVQQAGGTGNQMMETLVKTPSQQKADTITRNMMIEKGWIEGDITPIKDTTGPGGLLRILGMRLTPRILRSTYSIFDGSKRKDQIIGHLLGLTVEPLDYRQISSYRTFPAKLYATLEEEYKAIQDAAKTGEAIDVEVQQRLLDKLNDIKFKALKGKSGLEEDQQYMFLSNEIKLLGKLMAGEITYEQLVRFRIKDPLN